MKTELVAAVIENEKQILFRGIAMTAYYFLPQDFELLNRQITSINDRIKEIGHEMGASCEEGAETYHDNFAYEDGERQQYMWSKRLKEFLSLRNQAKVVTLDNSQSLISVSMGCTVRILDMDADEEKEFKIGSYMVFSAPRPSGDEFS